jgi:hypothetical protein
MNFPFGCGNFFCNLMFIMQCSMGRRTFTGRSAAQPQGYPVLIATNLLNYLNNEKNILPLPPLPRRSGGNRHDGYTGYRRL